MPAREGARRLNAIVGLTWALAFAQVLTIQPAQPFSFPEPLSWEQWALAAVFLITSLGLVGEPPRRILAAGHVAVVTLILLLHPLTAFGRDGSAVVLMIWLVLALGRLSCRREWAILAASSCIGLLAAETLLARIGATAPPAGLLDYGSVMAEYGDCGFLRPNLDVEIVGEDGPATFVTNSLGLRYDREIAQPKTSKGRRILFLGDSFVAGYRIGQRETVGARLETLLRAESGLEVEVLPAGVGHPLASLRVAKTCGARLRPDVLLVGVTLGNDLSQSWLDRHRLPADVLGSLFLPPDAYKDWFDLLPVKILRSVRAWRLFGRIEGLFTTEVISSWYHDAPTEVHLLDPGHSLGHFYVRRELDLVGQSYGATLGYMNEIALAAAELGARPVFVFFPQRFQVTPQEWEATLFEYGLDPAAFDRDAPNRRLLSGCQAGGLTCVDLLPAFRAAAGRGALYLPRGDMHWNRRGHEVAARALVVALAGFVTSTP